MIDWRQLSQISNLRALDLQAGRLVERLGQEDLPAVPLLAALTSWAAGQGHTCLPLGTVAALAEELNVPMAVLQDMSEMQQQLNASSMAGRADTSLPLILDEDNKLFLYRYHRCEATIAQVLAQRVTQVLPVDQERALPLLDQLFPASAPGIDWQRAAAALALYKSLVVISGGPGTGKTYTVARILALVQQLANQPLRTALVAPTGKAALRLQESIGQAKQGLPQEAEKILTLKAQTLHRLLGYQAHRAAFRHNRHNPLHLDLLVVDEASMIDVSLMAALLEALPSHCRLVLLGDRDQLASVEAGNLFADICGPENMVWSQAQCARLAPLLGGEMPQAENASNPLADCLVLLQTSRRFAAGSGIGALAQAVNAGNGEMVKGIIDSQWSDVRWLETNVSAPAGQQPHVRKQILQFLTPLLAAKSPQAALQALGQRRILCGLREGPGGVAGVNHLVEQHQRRQQLIGPEARVYAGLPILISRNDYSQGLFNGDTGVLWPDAKGLMRGWFEQEDGSLRSVALAQLPAWQVAYAMTVHKSQGSEFDQVLLLLPQEDAPVLTRELLYTGITRARQQLILCAPLELFLRTTGRQVIRYSGLPRKMTTPPPQLNQE